MELEPDTSREEIREKLSKMTFEELQKLKEKLGLKVYNEAVFGSKTVKAQEFKRANKNRPREISSKRPEPTKIKKKASQQTEIRDPRFDSLCGDFDDREFRKSYGFIGKIRKKESMQLALKLKSEDDPDERKRIKIALQRLRNKERDEAKKAEKDQKALAEREERIQMLKEGKKPHFKSKLEAKVSGLVEQYAELKKKGKLQKHVEKQRKKKSQKEKKRGFLDEHDFTF